MKTRIRTQFLLPWMLLAGLFPAVCQAQFTAEMVNVQPRGERVFKVTHNGARYRYDFKEGNEEMILIVDPGQKRSSILIPSMQFVHYMEIQSMNSLSNDPVQSFFYFMDNYDTKEGDTESVNGRAAKVIEVKYGDQKLFTCWLSEELNFPLKIVNEQQKGMYMELRNISIGETDPSLFEIPEFYTEVDNKMRPVIPEPPAPTAWKEIKQKVPFVETFSRGDKIRFIVETGIYHKLILENASEEPAKVISFQFRNGELVPDNEQGPVSTRTSRLYKGEKTTDTRAWKKGVEIVLEVHEGQMKIEVKPER